MIDPKIFELREEKGFSILEIVCHELLHSMIKGNECLTLGAPLGNIFPSKLYYSKKRSNYGLINGTYCYFLQGCRIPSRPMICNYSSQITNEEPQTATIIVDDSEAENDWPALVNSLRSEKLKLAQSLNAMMAEKESLAISLEGNLTNFIL